jgi:hypothetical protein
VEVKKKNAFPFLPHPNSSVGFLLPSVHPLSSSQSIMPATRQPKSTSSSRPTNVKTRSSSSSAVSNPFNSSSKSKQALKTGGSSGGGKGGKPKKRTEKDKEADRALMAGVEKDLGFGIVQQQKKDKVKAVAAVRLFLFDQSVWYMIFRIGC